MVLLYIFSWNMVSIMNCIVILVHYCTICPIIASLVPFQSQSVYSYLKLTLVNSVIIILRDYGYLSPAKLLD